MDSVKVIILLVILGMTWKIDGLSILPPQQSPLLECLCRPKATGVIPMPNKPGVVFAPPLMPCVQTGVSPNILEIIASICRNNKFPQPDNGYPHGILKLLISIFGCSDNVLKPPQWFLDILSNCRGSPHLGDYFTRLLHKLFKVPFGMERYSIKLLHFLKRLVTKLLSEDGNCGGGIKLDPYDDARTQLICQVVPYMKSLPCPPSFIENLCSPRLAKRGLEDQTLPEQRNNTFVVEASTLQKNEEQLLS